MKVKLQTLGLVSVICLSGCLGLSSERYLQHKYNFMVEKGDPKAYAEGYVDGCAVGRRLAGDKRFNYRKNTLRFEKDALYARGWQDGQIDCRNEVLAESMGIRTQHPDKKSARMSNKSQEEQEAIAKEMADIWDELKK